MNPQEMQQNNPQMTPEEAKASLGIATRLTQEHFNPSQDAQNGLGQEIGGKMGNRPYSGKTSLKDEIMQDVKNALKSEIGALKEEIMKAISEEDDKEETNKENDKQE